MFIRIRTIKGRQYRYAEARWREGKRVRSRSTFLGAVNRRIKEGWLKSQLGHRYGNLTEEEQEKRNALCKEDPAERPAHPGKVLDRSGLKPGSILAVSKEPPVLDALVQANASANIDFAEEGPADEGEAGAQ